MGTHDHKESAEATVSGLTGGVLTISDSRIEATDESGSVLRSLLEGAGHRAQYGLIPNEPNSIRTTIREWVGAGVDFIITAGGTGMSPRDLTIESVRPLFTRELEGFGDIFRYLSFQEIGSTAIMSRATAGSVGRAMLFCLPGSTAAVQLAAERLILPEIKHLLAQVRKG